MNKYCDGSDVVSLSLWFQMEVLQESRMMIPDCHRRLVTAHSDLLQLLVRNTQTHNNAHVDIDPFASLVLMSSNLLKTSEFVFHF